LKKNPAKKRSCEDVLKKDLEALIEGSEWKKQVSNRDGEGMGV